MSSPRVSVVFPNRDNEAALELILERLASNTTYENLEVVVVDDGSQDRSLEILRRWRDSGRFARFILEEREASGVVVTLNRGLELATGEVIVQMDADASVETAGWTERMLRLLLVSEAVGAVTGKVVFDSGHLHAAGIDIVVPEGFHDRGTRVMERCGRRRYHQHVLRYLEAKAPIPNTVAEVDSGIGCCLMYRRADALSVGGYDLGYQPVWFDDMDLGLTLRRFGKKVLYTPEVRVIHRLSLRGTRIDRFPPPTLMQRIGRRLPPIGKAYLSARLNLGLPGEEQWQRLQHHYAYWQQKWGWDLLNPDLEAIRRRYGSTEIWWRHDEAMRREGERLIAAAGAGRGP